MTKQTTIVLGTKNPHKVREILAISRSVVPQGQRTNVRLIPLSRFKNVPNVKESGRTYLANATKKAVIWARFTGLPVLAEDSGIEVKALGWKPGLHSARFASNRRHKNATDAENIRKLLDMMSGLPFSKRTARYRCSAVLASPNGRILARAEGTCWGRIAMKPSGRNGFGYDPVFTPTPNPLVWERTFGQLPARVKHRISHRTIALRKIFLMKISENGWGSPEYEKKALR